MPPNSQYLWQEGMCVKSFKLVCEGKFQEEGQFVHMHVRMLVTSLCACYLVMTNKREDIKIETVCDIIVWCHCVLST